MKIEGELFKRKGTSKRWGEDEIDRRCEYNPIHYIRTNMDIAVLFNF